ncbi:Na+/H+ antiporter NhaA, partial [Dermacoccus nishinomiyaensis]|uniref:Na+/H+ antiporter NhaA n=1 Tax=Dermacoccus nishinomiyaensis TaxID=1274 RepID=UPI0021B659F2
MSNPRLCFHTHISLPHNINVPSFPSPLHLTAFTHTPTSPPLYPYPSLIPSHLPTAFPSFLLTLPLLDHLIPITIIPIFYTHAFSLTWLLPAIVPIAL